MNNHEVRDDIASPSQPSKRSGHYALAVITIAVAVAALVVSTTAIWSVRSHTGSSVSTKAIAGPFVPNGLTKTFQVTLGDLFVRPSSVSVEFGTKVVLNVKNQGVKRHDLQLEGGSAGTGMLAPGQQGTVNLGAVYRSTQAWCTVPGHKAAGMILSIDVSNELSGTSAVNVGDATVNFATPPPVAFHAADPFLPFVPAGQIHNVTIVAEDKEMQVGPGVTQDMWTFNGQVPGPTLQGRVGDVFNITFINHSSMDHSLDFHAFGQPLSQMASAPPGGTVTEQVKATLAGIYLYHCGTAPVIEHLANGMFGAVIISPPNLTPVSQQLLFVQSELYLGPQRDSGDYVKMLSGKPDEVVFNGYANQYAYDPIKVPAGQRLRIWVLDAGPSHDTSFHVVGGLFDTVFKEGAYLLQPDGHAKGGSQVLDLMPGQGGFVELTLAKSGRYEFLDHHLDHAVLGAAGFLVAN